jgi:hypothetical protein
MGSDLQQFSLGATKLSACWVVTVSHSQMPAPSVHRLAEDLKDENTKKSVFAAWPQDVRPIGFGQGS